VVASFDLDAATRIDWHEHDAHQLSVAADGVLSMGVADATWVLPRSRALWIPAGVRHTVDSIGVATMTTVWFDPATCRVAWPEPTVVEVGDLLASLVAYLDDRHLAAPARSRAEALLFDLLKPVPLAVIHLDLPTDDRARTVADAILADPADSRPLAEWGRAVGASDRTLMRAFLRETGRGFVQWRTQARVAAALPRLAAGEPVEVVGRRVGYANASAFGAAFRRTVGLSPSEYFTSDKGGRGLG
jgi:AraC-like DNA-binding protein